MKQKPCKKAASVVDCHCLKMDLTDDKLGRQIASNGS